MEGARGRVPSTWLALVPQPVAVAGVAAEAVRTGELVPIVGAGLILAAVCWLGLTVAVVLRSSISEAA